MNTVEFQISTDDFVSMCKAQHINVKQGDRYPRHIRIGGEWARVLGQAVNERGQWVDRVRIEAPERIASWLIESGHIEAPYNPVRPFLTPHDDRTEL